MQRYQALLRVIYFGSFTKAGEELGYSTSAVSKMISSLEEELEMRLIVRSRYGISLTPEGEQLLPYIQGLVGQHESMQTAVNDIRGLMSGQIRIGAFASISIGWLAPLMGEFWKTYPGIQFDVAQADYTTIIEMVRSGRLDIGFVNGRAAAAYPGLKLRTDEFKLLLPQGHPLADKEKIRLEDIQAERFLMIRTGDREKYNDLVEAFEERNVSISPALHVDDDYTILSMVENGFGISILSEKILSFAGRSVIVRSLDPPILRDTCVITADLHKLPVACKKFLSFLKERIGALP